MGFRLRARGLTLTDLLVATVCLMLLSVAGISCSQKQREVESRVKCAENLKLIGQAMLLYSNDNRGQYPRTHHNPDLSAHPLTAFTVPEADNPLAFDLDGERRVPRAGKWGEGGAPAYNDVTAALFLLLRTQNIGPERFVCPSSTATPDALNGESAQMRSNFTSSRNLSYSVATPYPSTDAIKVGYRWSANTNPELILVADINPGTSGRDITDPTFVDTLPKEQLRQGNSPNHNRDGQNALFADGHVEFVETPFVGVNHDNIYTKAASAERGDTTSSRTFDGTMAPTHQYDSILLPLAREGTPGEQEKKAE